MNELDLMLLVATGRDVCPYRQALERIERLEVSSVDHVAGE